MPRINDSELKRLKDEVSVQRLVEEQQAPDCKPLFVGLDTRLGVSPIWTAEVLSCTLRALRFALGVARKPQQDAHCTDYGLRAMEVLLQNCCLSQRRSLCSALFRRRAVLRHGFRAPRTELCLNTLSQGEGIDQAAHAPRFARQHPDLYSPFHREDGRSRRVDARVGAGFFCAFARGRKALGRFGRLAARLIGHGIGVDYARSGMGACNVGGAF